MVLHGNSIFPVVRHSEECLAAASCYTRLTGTIGEIQNTYISTNIYDQVMFGTPQLVDDDASVFQSVWTYVIKALNGRKKACFACDGSPSLGQA
jgi:hypothetical protein